MTQSMKGELGIGGITTLALAIVLVIVATSFGSQFIEAIDNSFADGSYSANTTRDLGSNLLVWTELFPSLGLLLIGLVLLFVLRQFF